MPSRQNMGIFLLVMLICTIDETAFNASLSISANYFYEPILTVSSVLLITTKQYYDGCDGHRTSLIIGMATTVIQEKETTTQCTTYWKLKELNARNSYLCQRMDVYRQDLEEMT
eukprot:706622_1